MDEDIINFIQDNKVASICFINKEELPYCINCFYAYDGKKQMLVFKSSTGTSHDELAITANKVSGTILPDNLNVLAIQGIQFSGEVVPKDKLNNWDASAAYYARFPFAMAMPGYLWAVELTGIKFTDNTKGFGTKLNWKK